MNIYVEKKLFKPLERDSVGFTSHLVFVSPFSVISVLSNVEIVTADVQNDFLLVKCCWVVCHFLCGQMCPSEQ